MKKIMAVAWGQRIWGPKLMSSTAFMEGPGRPMWSLWVTTYRLLEAE